MRSLASDKRYLIDVTKPWHVAWWAAELGVSEDSLLDIIDIVGNQALAVEYYLGSARHASSVRPWLRQIPVLRRQRPA
jgi:Protein of unknown function (DUF3606)